jgi:shikimate dehydrogenase
MISGNTKLIAHLGFPTHSFKAPLIYNPYFEKNGIDAVVVPMGCRPEDYTAFLKLVFRLSNIHGALITMPHKITTMGLLDQISTNAQVAGACNAVRIGLDGRLIGDMFDGEGFVRGVLRKGRQISGMRAIMAGTGGVACQGRTGGTGAVRRFRHHDAGARRSATPPLS